MKANPAELPKSRAFIVSDIIEYLPHSILIRSILRKGTGSVSAISFDAGETMNSKTSPFDTLIEIVDGKAEIVIDDVSNLLETGESIIIPANSRNSIRANVQFKMTSTIIKSGYEEILL